jgi:hypothetical protein
MSFEVPQAGKGRFVLARFMPCSNVPVGQGWVSAGGPVKPLSVSQLASVAESDLERPV